MSEEDRKTILRRRAFLVTSTLAALGSCARATTSSTESGPASVVSIPGAESDAGEVDESAPPAAARDAATVLGMPSMDVPDGVSPFTQKQYESLHRVMKRVHGHLGEIEANLPQCSILDQSCESRFARVAANLNAIDDSMEDIDSCVGKSAEARAFREQQAAHLHFVSERRKRAENSIAQLIAPGGAAAQKRWQTLLQAAATPRPCLEYSCPEW